jgi:hypothetical protein
LTHSDGTITSTHEGKAELLFDSYKERLGQVAPTSNSFDMASLLASSVDLSFLEEPFTPKEIDDVVKEFPCNKSPGPNGFNAEFFRKCWTVIKKDLYYLCNQFHQGDLCWQIINNCFITLVPKKQDAATTNDDRSISLLNCRE